VLEGLGIDGVAARLYHALIRLGEGDQAELAQRSALTAAQVQAGLASLEAVGLVTQRDDRVIAFRPELAIEAAVAEREGRLARARTAGQLLANEYRADQPPRVSGDVVEIIEGREAIVARHQQLQRQAQAEIITFESPPYLSDVTQLNHAELSRLDRGISVRGVYASASLTYPGRVESLRHEVAAGEEARVLPEVPLKMSVVDRTAALVPLTMDPDGFEHAIVLGPCTLLDALVGLFDVLWTRAIPLDRALAGEVVAEPAWGQVDRDVLVLLTSGATDDAIARQLQVSVRTVRRRIALLLTTLDARTRFQAGVQAQRRGLI
jgi:sugar-specific transcriptional regulator TrmB/DNA-binding CsgD family transcriptional regulator